jgi:iron(III) transport system substrate-binding protein
MIGMPLVRRRTVLTGLVSSLGVLLTGGGFRSLVPGAAAQTDPRAEWTRVLEAAKREGRVAVAGAPSPDFRAALGAAFGKAYPDIKVEYTGLGGRDVVPRIMQEHKAGVFQWDVYVAGATSVMAALKPLDTYFAPLKPALVLPEILDDARWRDGFDAGFLDRQRKLLYAFDGTVTKPIWINWDKVAKTELTSPRDLLSPKFSGKIVWDDPRTHGPGVAASDVFLLAYGEEFLKKAFGQQQIVYTRDGRQLVEWVVQGRYPIGVGLQKEILDDFQKVGVGKNVSPLADRDYPLSSLIPGFGAVALMARAPHPNAAKVYVNWLMSAEGQRSWASTTTRNSRRVDVAPGDQERAPQAGHKYVNTMTEEMLATRQRSIDIARELIPG